MKECVLVLYGGKSVEHDISIITAMQVSKNLPVDFSFELCYITREGTWFLAENLREISIYQNFDKLSKKKRRVAFLAGENVLYEIKKGRHKPLFRVSCVLNCCHGHIGEDGGLQGLLECCEVPQTSPNILQSSLCMDKAFFKEVCMAKGIETPDFLVFHDGESRQDFENAVIENLKFPLIIKPASLGSSIGISMCKNGKELHETMDFALTFSQKVIAEKAVENLREFNCACFLYHGKFALSYVLEVTNKSDFYTFDEKYLSSEKELHEANVELSHEIKNLTKKVYREFELSGVVRVDFLFDSGQGKLYVNEVNTIPGSLAFYLFKEVTFPELISCMIEQALRDYELKNSKITTFDSDALKIFESAAAGMKK